MEKSDDFNYAKNDKYINVNIYMEETKIINYLK